MKTFTFKQVAVTTICTTLCLSVVSCCDGAVSFDSESAENESSHNVESIFNTSEDTISKEPYITENVFVLDRADPNLIRIKASYPVLHSQNAAIDEKINQCIQIYVDSVYKGVDDSEAAIHSLDSVMMYEITLLNQDILSIHFMSSFAGSGAPQYVNDMAYTFDLQSGEQIALMELYSADELQDGIQAFFDELDELMYPTMFSLEKKDDVKADFLKKFGSGTEDIAFDVDHSYYISEDHLYLIAGWYKGYTFDIDSPLHGDRSFIAKIKLSGEQ